MNNTSLQYLRVFFASLAVLTLTYLPCLIFSYAYHDDFRFWAKIPHETTLHPYFIENIVYGRLVSSFLLTLAGWFVSTLSDLAMLRALSILLLSISATISIYAIKKYFKDDLRNAFLFMMMVFTLPPFQIMASYGAYFFLPFTLILASWAAVVARTKILAAIILLFLAFATYASAAVFYWFVAACLIASAYSQSQNIKPIMLRIFSAGFGATFLYAFYLKLIKQFYSQYTSGIYDPYTMSMNLPEKSLWFIREPLNNVLNFWNVFPSRDFSIFVVLFLACAVLLYLRKIKFIPTILRIFLFFLLLILSFLPNLLAQGNAPFYRCLAGLASIMTLFLIWAIKQWLSVFPENKRNSILTIFLIIGTVYGILSAQHTILKYRIIPSLTEFNHIKTVLMIHDLKSFEQIHLVLPKPNRQTNRYDEFGFPANVFPQDFRGLLTCALRESGKQKEFYNKPIKLSVGHQTRRPENFSKPTLIINMKNSPNGIYFEPNPR